MRISGIHLVYRDLAAEPIAHLLAGYLGAAQNPAGPRKPAIQHDLSTGGAVLEECLAADIVVIGVSLDNITVSNQLKAWVDRILVAGKTFRCTETGANGLAGEKTAVLAVARGGFYGPDAPYQSFEHAESYMRAV